MAACLAWPLLRAVPEELLLELSVRLRLHRSVLLHLGVRRRCRVQLVLEQRPPLAQVCDLLLELGRAARRLLSHTERLLLTRHRVRCVLLRLSQLGRL